MELGPTLLARVSFTSMFLSVNIETRQRSTESADCCSVSCLSVCDSNGRAVHYNGSSLLQWKSVRLDVALLPGEMRNLTCSHVVFDQSREISVVDPLLRVYTLFAQKQVTWLE